MTGRLQSILVTSKAASVQPIQDLAGTAQRIVEAEVARKAGNTKTTRYSAEADELEALIRLINAQNSFQALQAKK